jgi:6-phosphogluconolactonase (cycloisomerase 2 family)
VAIAINAAGTFLFVVDYYQPVYTDLNPGPGAIIVYPVNSDGSLGAAVGQTLPSGAGASYYPIENTPSAVSVLPNGGEVFVTDQLLAAVNGGAVGQGAIEALAVNSSGVVAPVSGSPYPSGVTPGAISTDPAGSYLYVADSTENQISIYPINSNGTLPTTASAVAATGVFPDGLTFNAAGTYLYVANRNSNNIQGYSITSGTGMPVSIGSYATGPYPQCVIVDPNLNRFVYTADFQGLGSTGYEINPTTGELTGTENSPYAGTGQATCLAATPHNKSAQGKGSA